MKLDALIALTTALLLQFTELIAAQQGSGHSSAVLPNIRGYYDDVGSADTGTVCCDTLLYILQKVC